MHAVTDIVLNPKIDTPPFAAAVAAAAPLQLYHVDPVHQPWGLINICCGCIWLLPPPPPSWEK